MNRKHGALVVASLVALVGGCNAILGLNERLPVDVDGGVGSSTTGTVTATATSASGTGGTSASTSASTTGGGGMPPCTLSPLVHVTTLAGTGLPGFVEGAGASAQFDTPEGITVDPQGNLYVADGGNARVRKVLADGTTSTFSGPTGFLSPRRIARHTDGNYYMVDPTGDALEHITPAGVATMVVGLGGIVSVGISPTGSIYVGETQSCTLGLVTGNTSNFFSGSACGFNDGTATSAKYGLISDIAFDTTGDMYVADTTNYRVRKVASDGSAATFAGSVQGHVDGIGGMAQFEGPTGLTLDPQQHILYVADSTRIRAVDASGNVTTVVGSTSGLVDGNGCEAKFGALQGITYFAGALYAVDINRIRKVTLP